MIFFKKVKNTIKDMSVNKNRKTIFSFDMFLFFLLPIFFLIILIHGVNYFFSNISPFNSYFLDKDISLKNKVQIKEIISDEQNKILNTKIAFTIEDDMSNKIVKSVLIGDLIEKNSEDKIIENIFHKFSKVKIDPELFLENLFKTKKYNFNYSLNSSEIEKIKENIKQGERPTINALIIKDESSKKFTIQKEEHGYNYDLSKIETEIINYINSSDRKNLLNISISKIPNNPKITEDSLKNILTQANSILDNAPINIFYNDNKILLDKTELIDMLNFKHSVDLENNLTESSIGLKEEDIKKYLEGIAEKNDEKPHSGELIIKDNKVVKFSPVKKGLSLDKEDSFNKLQDTILSLKNNVYLTIEESVPSDMDSDVVKYGLLEKIAEGKSNFKGSTANRIHNIKVGSNFVNGTLVKPGEEFSMIKTLKAVNAEMGYLPELVIKGNQTEAEYGGGLCQVATTVFRTSINGGFPILERQNHSYRVPYYEPAGTDATIYFPKPDFRFLNNTKNYILIATEVDVKNNELIYSIWGTKDNRKIKISDPVVTNIVLAPGTKWIETLDLPVGKTKCIESSHNGADAEFSYNVEYEDGTKFDRIFKSRYRPWQAVCLKGVEKLSSDTSEPKTENVSPEVNNQ